MEKKAVYFIARKGDDRKQLRYILTDLDQSNIKVKAKIQTSIETNSNPTEDELKVMKEIMEDCQVVALLDTDETRRSQWCGAQTELALYLQITGCVQFVTIDKEGLSEDGLEGTLKNLHQAVEGAKVPRQIQIQIQETEYNILRIRKFIITTGNEALLHLLKKRMLPSVSKEVVDEDKIIMKKLVEFITSLTKVGPESLEEDRKLSRSLQRYLRTAEKQMKRSTTKCTTLFDTSALNLMLRNTQFVRPVTEEKYTRAVSLLVQVRNDISHTVCYVSQDDFEQMWKKVKAACLAIYDKDDDKDRRSEVERDAKRLETYGQLGFESNPLQLIKESIEWLRNQARLHKEFVNSLVEKVKEIRLPGKDEPEGRLTHLLLNYIEDWDIEVGLTEEVNLETTRVEQ